MATKTKPGKYDEIVKTLKPQEKPVTDNELLIRATKDKITDRDAISLGKAYITLRKQKAKIEDELSDVQVMIEAYERLLSESQERQAAGWGDYGVSDKTLKMVTGGTIRLEPVPRGSVKDVEAFRRWCIKAGYERQLVLHSGTMNSIVKERLVAGMSLPDGVEVFLDTKFVYTKGEE